MKSGTKLLVDVGNSRIKWAYQEGETLTAHGAGMHVGEPRAAVAALTEGADIAPDAVLVANVAGAAMADALVTASRASWGIEPTFAATAQTSGRLVNAYAEPARLGVDRWLALLAAADRCDEALCVVDAGTAVTIDLVKADGEHLGGYILPGLDLMRRALADDTGDLARFLADQQPGENPSPGRSTADAIGHGALAAICALVERCATGEAGHNRHVVVTGGDAGRLLPHLAVNVEHRPHLVLEGLVLWRPV